MREIELVRAELMQSTKKNNLGRNLSQGNRKLDPAARGTRCFIIVQAVHLFSTLGPSLNLSATPNSPNSV
jgi:hypothetical protein